MTDSKNNLPPYHLKDRLPPEILSYDRWRELFEAVDEYWQVSLTRPIERLSQLRSVATASKDDLPLIMDDLSAFFDKEKESSLPLGIFWKKNEINTQNSEVAVEAFLQYLNISARNIDFIPLYALKDEARYGEEFYTKEKLTAMGKNMDDYFLSSHMTLRINWNEVLKQGWDKNEIDEEVTRYFEENVRPTHIVFDGLNFYFVDGSKFVCTTTINRLPPEILSYDRWRELFEAVDEYWQVSLTTPIERLSQLRSVATASIDDLPLIMDELSAFFDKEKESSQPLGIFWKKNEINAKNSEVAVEAFLQHLNISARNIDFIPLYALKDEARYGEEFYTEDELTAMGKNMDDYFLSSHMTLRINRNEVLKQGWDKNEIDEVVKRYFEENVRPTHIVFDGLNFYIVDDSKIVCTTTVQSNRITYCIAQ